MESNIEKFYIEKPIKEFNVNQTMYTMIKEESKNDMNLQATGFLGGKINVQSQYGKGSIFMVQIAQKIVHNETKYDSYQLHSAYKHNETTQTNLNSTIKPTIQTNNLGSTNLNPIFLTIIEIK